MAPKKAAAPTSEAKRKPGRPAGSKNKQELSDKQRALVLLKRIEAALGKLAVRYGRAGLDHIEANLELAKGELGIASNATNDLPDDFKFPRGVSAAAVVVGSTVLLKADYADIYDGLLPSGDLKVTRVCGKHLGVEGLNGMMVVVPRVHVSKAEPVEEEEKLKKAASAPAPAAEPVETEQDGEAVVPDLDL